MKKICFYLVTFITTFFIYNFCEATQVDVKTEYNSLVDLINQGQTDTALNQAIAIVTQGIADEKIYNIVGAIYNVKNMQENAIPYLVNAVTANPNYAYAHFNLGYAYHSVGFQKKNRNYFRLAAMSYESFFKTYNSGNLSSSAVQADLYESNMNMGFALCEVAEFSKAIEYFSRALAAKSNDNQAIASLTYAYAMVGNKAQAFYTLHPMIANPNFYGIYYNTVNPNQEYYTNYYNQLNNYYSYLGLQAFGPNWWSPYWQIWTQPQVTIYNSNQIIPFFYNHHPYGHNSYKHHNWSHHNHF